MVGNARESPFLFNSIYFSPKTNDLIQGWIDWICIFIFIRLKIQCSFFCFWELDSSRHSIYQTKTFGSQFHISLRTYSLSMETVAISRAVSVTHSLRLNSQFHGQCHVTTQIYLLKTSLTDAFVSFVLNLWWKPSLHFTVGAHSIYSIKACLLIWVENVSFMSSRWNQSQVCRTLICYN